MRYTLVLLLCSACEIPSIEDFQTAPQSSPEPIVVSDPADPQRDWVSVMDGFWQQQEPCTALFGSCVVELRVTRNASFVECDSLWLLQVVNFNEADIQTYVLPCFYSDGKIEIKDSLSDNHLTGHVTIEPVSDATCVQTPTGQECIEGMMRYTLHTTLTRDGTTRTRDFVKIPDPPLPTFHNDPKAEMWRQRVAGYWMPDVPCVDCTAELRLVPTIGWFASMCPTSHYVLQVVNHLETSILQYGYACFETDGTFEKYLSDEIHGTRSVYGHFDELGLTVIHTFGDASETRAYHKVE